MSNPIGPLRDVSWIREPVPSRYQALYSKAHPVGPNGVAQEEIAGGDDPNRLAGITPSEYRGDAGLEH